ncbi:MAG: hypothetical protein HWE39_20195 [Oceanospirillaceae bacterium]|nr:hypothetical protein [Oceanospirillaceae bacterium]
MVTKRVWIRGGIGVAVVAITTATATLLLQRDTDTGFARSITDTGDELYRFTGALTPTLPDDPESADDFDAVLGLLALDDFALATGVSTAGDSVRWHDGRDREIRILGKTCPDDTFCVDSVLVHPEPDQRLHNIDTAFGNARLVTPGDYEAWPFTVDQAVLRCTPPKAATLITAEQVYALNAPAKTADRNDIGEILKDHPLRAGEKQPFGAVFFDAIALCGKAGPIAAGG